jgi:methylated-DNA-[protein]-cysteine S-methyltransferase
MQYRHVESPIGRLLLAGDGDVLHHVVFPQAARPFVVPSSWRHAPDACREACRQLDAYFAGRLRVFDLRLAPAGTPFQRLVLDALARIPYGTTWSYADVARALGRPLAARAVGAANARNPLPVVIPCHRVIGAGGALTGFGGGIDTKRWLLAHEAAHAAPLPDTAGRGAARPQPGLS